MKIPDYYRQFQNQPAEPETIKVDTEKKPVIKIKQEEQPKDKTKIYQGNGFTINQLDDWEDKTIYTLAGPVTDGVQHNIIITFERDIPFDNIIDYAEMQIRTLETELRGCILLKKGEKKLNSGADGYEAVFSWIPIDELKIYQQQIFILFESIAYKLTASFTKKTFNTLGPQVERMMLSFNPSLSK